MTPVKLGIIGCGKVWHRAHLPALSRLREYFAVVGVCARTEQSAERAANALGVPLFTHHADLLAIADLEAVAVLTPTYLNARIVSDVLRASKHVLVEKPLAGNLAEAAALCEEAARHSVVAMVGENFRYSSVVREVRTLLAAGIVGQPALAVCTSASSVDVRTQAEWRRDHRHDGGYLLDGGVHYAAMLRELFGNLTQAGSVVGSRDPELGRYNSMSCHFTTTAGALVVWNFIRTAKPLHASENRLAVYGSDGCLILQDNILSVNGQSTVLEADARGFSGEYLDFWHAIRCSRPVTSTFEEGLRDMEIVLTALRAANEGHNTPSVIGK